jgi:hypothetical protein
MTYKRVIARIVTKVSHDVEVPELGQAPAASKNGSSECLDHLRRDWTDPTRSLDQRLEQSRVGGACELT